MRVELDGQVALVTGAARGIGRAIADTLAANGARVVYTDIDLEADGEAAAIPDGCTTILMDVTDEAQVEQSVAQVEEQFGRLDILVNNAGINTLRERVTIDRVPLPEWERIVSVDLTGVFIVSKAASQAMIRRKSGRIVNIASVMGLVPARLQCAYVAAKAGVVNLTKAMALELGPHGILVNCVAPGSIMTRGTRKLFYGEDGEYKEFAQTLLSHIPLARPGSPQEIAHAVLFLVAPESSYVNGSVLTVDGGWTAGYLREF